MKSKVIDGVKLSVESGMTHLRVAVLDVQRATLSQYLAEMRATENMFNAEHAEWQVARGMGDALERELQAVSKKRDTLAANAAHLSLLLDVHTRLAAIKKAPLQLGDQFSVNTFLPQPFVVSVAFSFGLTYVPNSTGPLWATDLAVLKDRDQSNITFVGNNPTGF